MPKVDAKTMVCTLHGELACMFCIIDDFHDWRAERKEKRRQLRLEREATPIHERYDLGGEA